MVERGIEGQLAALTATDVAQQREIDALAGDLHELRHDLAHLQELWHNEGLTARQMSLQTRSVLVAAVIGAGGLALNAFSAVANALRGK